MASFGPPMPGDVETGIQVGEMALRDHGPAGSLEIE